MNDQWWYTKDGKNTIGPVPFTALQHLVASGVVQPADMVYQQGKRWTQAQTVPGLLAAPQAKVAATVQPPVAVPVQSTQPAPIGAAFAQPQPQTGQQAIPTAVPSPGLSINRRLAILILTIVGGFFSITVGDSTSSAVNSVAELGESFGELQRRMGDSRDGSKSKKVAAELRMSGSIFAILGFLEAILGIVGGVYCYRKNSSASFLTVGPYRMKLLMVAAVSIFLGAALTITNTFAFISTGAMFTIAGILALLQDPSIEPET